MSKKKFKTPTMEIIQLHTANILTASTDAFDGEYVPIGGRSNYENNDVLIE